MLNDESIAVVVRGEYGAPFNYYSPSNWVLEVENHEATLTNQVLAIFDTPIVPTIDPDADPVSIIIGGDGCSYSDPEYVYSHFRYIGGSDQLSFENYGAKRYPGVSVMAIW